MSTPRLLVVDDEGSMLLTLTANLELEGFEVAEAANANRALELVREKEFDLVLSDIRMPGMNGVELFREIRAIRPELPVILMTAFALEGLVSEAIGAGAYTVLRKPFAIDHLLATVTRAAKNPIVLVVDRAEDASRTAETLRAVGVSAMATQDVEGTLATLAGRTVDVCVLDVAVGASTRKSDGDLVERLRAREPSIAIIAIAGVVAPELMTRIASLGAYACMKKPVSRPELLQIIANARSAAASNGAKP
jgi:DNA-binding NtrC family response regulator